MLRYFKILVSKCRDCSHYYESKDFCTFSQMVTDNKDIISDKCMLPKSPFFNNYRYHMGLIVGMDMSPCNECKHFLVEQAFSRLKYKCLREKESEIILFMADKYGYVYKATDNLTCQSFEKEE